MDYHQCTAHEILDLIKQGTVTVNEVYASVKDQIDRTDRQVNAYVRSYPQSDEKLQDRSRYPYPIPIAIKDNICIKGQETTCASHILNGFKPPYNATVIEKLEKSGAIFLGNANMDEFAFGSSTETSFYGPTKNPWDLSYVPGGSSGGSTAAVAADEAIWAIGSDTGGSIRQPASLCGVVGLKPTYGRVSRYGLIAFASSLDQIGPITKDVQDAALLLNILSGHDVKDSTSADSESILNEYKRTGREKTPMGPEDKEKTVPDYTQALIPDVKGLRIGIPKEYFVEGMDPEVKNAVLTAIDTLKQMGATFVDISLPHTEYAVATYYIIATAEASSNLARFDGVEYGLRERPTEKRKTTLTDMYEQTRHLGFGREAKRRILLGTYALSSGYYDAYYLKGLKVRSLIKQDFDQAFQELDAVITPTSPTTAFRIGERANDPLSMYLSDIYTISANLSGIPAISVPCGFSRQGLPIGLQIMTNAFNEDILFRVAYAYEQKTQWKKQKPTLPGSDHESDKKTI
jgi:aspartyl-tRNA(Asn)/glutamyl-tRNA(Gln) amidotransferase subunit A